MDKSASPKAEKSPQTSPEAPFTTFIQLDGKSAVPSQFRTPRKCGENVGTDENVGKMWGQTGRTPAS
jgi:hypothetical protein